MYYRDLLLRNTHPVFMSLKYNYNNEIIRENLILLNFRITRSSKALSNIEICHKPKVFIKFYLASHIILYLKNELKFSKKFFKVLLI